MKWHQVFVVVTLSYLAAILATDDCDRPNCTATLCEAPDCVDGIIFTPPGQCCGTCLEYEECEGEPYCDDVKCEDLCCEYGSYTTPCDCCAKCVGN